MTETTLPDVDLFDTAELDARRRAAREKLSVARALAGRATIDMTLQELSDERDAVNRLLTEDNTRERELGDLSSGVRAAADDLARLSRDLDGLVLRLRNRRALSFAQLQSFHGKLAETTGARIRQANDLDARLAQLQSALDEQTELADEYARMLRANGVAV